MINGVLVERTVKEVVPALKTNSEGLKKVLDELVVQYKSKQDEMEKWKVWHSIMALCTKGHVLTTNRKRIMYRLFSSKGSNVSMLSTIFMYCHHLIEGTCIQIRAVLRRLTPKPTLLKPISAFEPELTRV
jgi:hypothetical protein